MLKEEIIVSEKFSVTGVLTYAVRSDSAATVVLLNAGLIPRIGPQRNHVRFARELALEGYHVFRCDFGGQGDSLASNDAGIGSEFYVAEIIDLLQKYLKSKNFILMGLCSGAESAYRSALTDPRIKGVIMINGTGLEPEVMNILYSRAVRSIKYRLMKKKICRLWQNPRKTNEQSVIKDARLYFRKDWLRLIRRKQTLYFSIDDPICKLTMKGISVLLLTTEGSTAFDLIKMTYGFENGNKYPYEHIIAKNIDHTITPVWAQLHVNKKVMEWIEKCFPNK